MADILLLRGRRQLPGIFSKLMQLAEQIMLFTAQPLLILDIPDIFREDKDYILPLALKRLAQSGDFLLPMVLADILLLLEPREPLTVSMLTLLAQLEITMVFMQLRRQQRVMGGIF